MKTFFKHIMCFMIIFFSLNTISAQESSDNNIHSFFKNVKESPNTFHKINSNSNWDKLQTLKDLEFYQNDSIDNIRKYTYLIADNLTKDDSDLLLKQNVVNFLLNGFSDKNSGNCGIVSDLLKKYPLKSFNITAQQKILKLLYKSPSYYHELIKLAGYVNPDSTSDLIHKLLLSRVVKNNESYWAAQLALARIGDQSAIEFCMNQIKQMKVNDDLIYDFVPDLIYTHQHEAINYLVQLLYSKEKNCESSNPESTEMIVCGYRIMEYLAPIIKNFPLKINNTGDIDTNDYAEALQICRDWFIENPNYDIITENY